MKVAISVALAAAKEKLGPSWKPTTTSTLTGQLRDAEIELCRRDPSYAPQMIKRPPLTEQQRAQLYSDLAKRRASTPAGATGDLWATYNTLKTPAEKREFYLAHKTELSK